MSKIKFHLPDFFGNIRMNLLFADEIKRNPQYFYDNIENIQGTSGHEAYFSGLGSTQIYGLKENGANYEFKPTQIGTYKVEYGNMRACVT